MPRLDGWDAAARLRSDPETAHVKVVLLSARAQEADLRTGESARRRHTLSDESLSTRTSSSASYAVLRGSRRPDACGPRQHKTGCCRRPRCLAGNIDRHDARGPRRRHPCRGARRCRGRRARCRRPRQATVERPATRSTVTTRPTSRCSWPSRPAGRRGSSPSWSPNGCGTPGIAEGRHRRTRFPQHPARRRTPGCAARATVVEAGRAVRPHRTRTGVRVNLEFVSANPTGPLHLGHTRWAAVGDALAPAARGRRRRRRRASTTSTTRGAQMDRFGASLLRRGRTGSRRRRTATTASTSTTSRAQVVADATPGCSTRPTTSAGSSASEGYRAHARARSRQSLARFGIDFDVWFSERSLHDERRSRARRSTRLRGAGPRVRAGRRGLDAHHRLRRRQGPGADPVQRRADLLRHRHGVLPRQAASAASTAASTCSAPTTTATSAGCGRWPRAPATTRTATSRC